MSAARSMASLFVIDSSAVISKNAAFSTAFFHGNRVAS